MMPSGQKQAAATAEKPRPGNVVGNSDAAALQAFTQLLRFESEVRRARSIRELDALAANDGQRLVRSRQAFVVEFAGRSCHVASASSLTEIDRSSPMIGWVVGMVTQLQKERGLAGAVEFSLPGFAPPDDDLTRQYPFRSVLWQPLWSPNGPSTTGILYFREIPWMVTERSIAERLSETIGHARTTLAAGGVRGRQPRKRKFILAASAIVAAAIGAIPVPISVLAPLEVVPRNADVVAMPIDGIVQQMIVQPNAKVAAGTPLVRLVDTVQRNRAAVAARDVDVASARVERATALAFSDPRGREELGVARADLALKRAEHAYAQQILEQTQIKAERAGIAVFSDPREVEGKPLSTGDRLMLIAREGESELKISLPVADSIVLRTGLPVKGFLDSDPLNSVTAEIAAIDRHVHIDESQVASFRITARLPDGGAKLTLGARGTAQIQGERAPLLLYVFRRPLVALRQWLGL